MMISTELAEPGMEQELAELWMRCFDEQREPVNYFFQNRYKPENCAAALYGGKIVAALHMLPAKLVQNGESVQVHYLYAAATLPKFRGQGVMSDLVEFACEKARQRADAYSVLLPATSKLYGFYEQLGYTRYFKTFMSELPQQEIQAAGNPAAEVEVKSFTARELCDIRNSFLERQEGAVLWDEQAVSYAVRMNALYGGKLVCVQKESCKAYALCRRISPLVCEVLEIMADDAMLPHLFHQIVRSISAQQYKLRLCRPYGLLGSYQNFGMLRPLARENTSEQLCGDFIPYMGLTLD